MKKSVKINYKYSDAQWLIQFFENEILVNWKLVNDSEEMKNEIIKFYFPK